MPNDNYHPFLSTPFNLLHDENLSAYVGGCTLPGFACSPDRQLHSIALPASLRSQIRNTESLIEFRLVVHIHQDAADKSVSERPKVILVTHSVGAYIALEILRRRAQGQSVLADVDVVGGVFFVRRLSISRSRRMEGKPTVPQYEGYIDFKQLRLRAHIDISHNSIEVVCCGHSRALRTPPTEKLRLHRRLRA
jgi:pimeloyl-ACP methyl ester carboxylesterase